jgi:hypothetical protein
MKTVTQQFIDEQLKSRSKGIRYEIMATVGSESKDLTPYLTTDSLNRIEHNIEESLTTFGNPDIQFTIWYNQEIWDWLHDNSDIEIEIKKGFPFEKIIVFSGYVDRDNLRQDTLGTIFVRAYSMSTKAKSITATYPWWTVVFPVKDLVKRLFNQLDIDNQTIKVKPIDLEDSTWSEFKSENWGTVSEPPFDKIPVIAINDYKFIFASKRRYGLTGWRYTIALLEFNEDYSDYEITQHDVATGTTLVNIIRWGDNHVAVIYGDKTGFNYKESSQTIPASEWIAEKIDIYDYDLTLIDTHIITTHGAGGYTFHPLAKSIRRIRNSTVFIIAFNGVNDTLHYINKGRIQRRLVVDNSVEHTWSLASWYINPRTETTEGYYSGFGMYYLIFLNPITSYTANNLYFRIHCQTSTWHIQSGDTGNSAAQLAGSWASCGQYVANDGGRIFDIHSCNIITSGWWTNLPTYVWTTKRDNLWYLTGYQVVGNTLECKVYDENTNDYSTTNYTSVIPVGYDVQLGAFSFLHEYDSRKNFMAIMRVQDNDDEYLHQFCCWGNRWFPYITCDYSGDSVRTVLDELAKAFCCICHFPDNDTGIFMSRDYLSDTEYTIDSLLRLKQWYIYPQSKQKVEVNDTIYGSGEKLLVIDSDFIPDSEVIRHGIAKKYYDFIDEWNMKIEFKGDFLIQYEPLDMLILTNPQDGYTYRGRIIKSIQEDNRVRFILRGKRL